MIAMQMKTVFGRVMKASLVIVILHVVMGLALAGRAARVFSLSSAAQPPVAPTLLQFTSGGHALGFAQDGMYAASRSHVLNVTFVGARPVEPQAASSAPARTGIAALGRVTYAGLWDGISLSYTSSANGVYSTTWTVAPGADPARIRLQYNAPLSLNTDGSLGIAFQTGTLTESAPVAWQNIDGQRVLVDVAFRLDGQQIRFSLGSYDPDYALTIDPTLTWNTFLGGSGPDGANAIALGANGDIYVVGTSQASWGNPLQPFTGGSDGFVARLDPFGHLIWNTFLGGVNNEALTGIVLDGAGNIFVSGDTGGTWGNPIRPFKGAWDVLAARLDPSGNLVWNTFLGGTGSDNAGGIALDQNGNAYIAGHSTTSWGSPLAPHQAGDDAFVAKLSPNGKLSWNSFLGGAGNDNAHGLALSAGGIFLTGESDKSWGSPVRSYDGGTDVFAAGLDSAGGLLWNTFLGGIGYDSGESVQFSASALYIVGGSEAEWGSPVRAHGSDFDIFAARLDSSGNLAWNTFLGGSAYDYGTGSALGANGRLYVAGYSEAAWGTPLRAYSGGSDALIAAVSPSGSLTWTAFLGGGGNDTGRGLASASTGALFLTGSSQAGWGSPVGAYSGSYDGYAVRLDPPAPFISRAAQDGWILESGELTGAGGAMNAAGNNLIVGDDASNRQYRSILSFDTSSLPDGAIITSARLKIRTSGQAGTNPFTTHGGMVVDIRKGSFSGNPALQLFDFKAAAGKLAAASFFKNPLNFWYTAVLPDTAYPFINTTGPTQLRLRFNLDDNNDLGADYIKFYSGNAMLAFRPQLIIEYYVP